MIAPRGRSVKRNCSRMLRAVLNKSLKLHPNETVAVQSFAFHLMSYLSKTNKTCWTLLENRDELINNDHQWTTTDGRTDLYWTTCKELDSSVLNGPRCRLENLPRVMADSNRWWWWWERERKREREYMLTMLLVVDDDDDLKKHFNAVFKIAFLPESTEI